MFIMVLAKLPAEMFVMVLAELLAEVVVGTRCEELAPPRGTAAILTESLAGVASTLSVSLAGVGSGSCEGLLLPRGCGSPALAAGLGLLTIGMTCADLCDAGAT